MKLSDEYPEGLRVSALALMEHTLLYLKKMPFTSYNAPNVIRAMNCVEQAMKEVSEAVIERRA